MNSLASQLLTLWPPTDPFPLFPCVPCGPGTGHWRGEIFTTIPIPHQSPLPSSNIHAKQTAQPRLIEGTEPVGRKGQYTLKDRVVTNIPTVDFSDPNIIPEIGRSSVLFLFFIPLAEESRSGYTTALSRTMGMPSSRPAAKSG